MEFTFARQAFAVAAVVRAASASDLDAKVAHALPRARRAVGAAGVGPGLA